jgi:hypothetical protein
MDRAAGRAVHGFRVPASGRRWAPLVLGLAVLVSSGCASAPASPAADATAAQAPPDSVEVPATPAADLPAEPAALEITCSDPYVGPGEGTLDYSFGYSTNAVEPFRVSIDYGDGRVYENDNAHLAAVFTHTYRSPGSRVVVATLTDAAGTVTQSNCTADWSVQDPPAPPAPAAGAPAGQLPVVGGGSTLCSDGTTTSSAGSQGACSWHGGLSGATSSGPALGSGSHYVQPYTRADGTSVRGYWRR